MVVRAKSLVVLDGFRSFWMVLGGLKMGSRWLLMVVVVVLGGSGWL